MVGKVLGPLLALLLAAQLPCLLTSCSKPTADDGGSDISTTASDAGALWWLSAAQDEAAVLFECDEIDAILSGDDPLVLTGDELTDRVLTLIDERRDSGDLLGSAFETLKSDFTVVAGWESEFGADPRYWHLRYRWEWYTDKPEDTPGDERGRLTEAAMLEQLVLAVKNDAADIPVLVTLWAGSVLQPELHSGIREELLHKMRELSPESAWPHYLKGFDLVAAREYGLAEAELSAGNAKELLEPLTLFPFGDLFARVSDGKLLGSAYTTFALMLLDYSTVSTVGDGAWIVFAAEDALMTDSEGIGCSLLSEVNCAAMRIALAGPPHRPSICEFICASYPWKTCEIYRANTALQSPENTAALAQVEEAGRLMTQIGTDLLEHGTDYVSELMAEPSDSTSRDSALLMVDSLEKLSWDLRLTQDHYRPWFRALKELDFTDLRPLPELDRLIEQRSH